MSQITLGDAVNQLWQNISATTSSDPVVIPSINKVLQKFYNQLDFDGKISADYPLNVNVIGYGARPTYVSIVALPGRYVVAEYLMDTSCRQKLAIRNEFNKYQPSACGCDDGYDSYGYGWGIGSPNNNRADDLGDDFSTWFDLPAPGHLYAIATATVSAATLVVNGLDANGYPLSETITLSVSGTTSASQFSRILSLKKTATTSDTLLYWIAPDATQVQIGQYDPNDVYPKVRRYLILRPYTSTSALVGKLRRRFIPAVNLTDIIIPGNIPALTSGLLAIKQQNEGNNEEYAKLWADARNELDGELQQLIGEVNTGTFTFTGPLSCLDNIP